MAYTWDRHDQDLHKLVVLALRELLVAVSVKPDLSVDEFAALAAIVTDKYGRAAAGSALLALENTRLDARMLGDLPRPEIVPPATAAQSMASASWAWNQSRGGALGAVQRFAGPLGKLVRQPARQTVWNASVTAGTRCVRVPGPKACSFCLMLASRGAVYTKETVTSTRGKGARPEGLRYHDHCDCQARESLTDADLPQVVRDLQDEWYEATYDENGRALPNQRQAWDDHIRATRPTHTSTRPPMQVPADDPRPHLGEANWKHILDGEPDDDRSGGHRHGTGRMKKTEFPESWSDSHIQAAVQRTLDNPHASFRTGDRRTLRRVVDGVLVEASWFDEGGILNFRTAYPTGGEAVTKNTPAGKVNAPLDDRLLHEYRPKGRR